MNDHILQRFRGIQGALLAHYTGGVSMPSAVKGNERETFVQDYLRELFPPMFRFGSGAVTDVAGNRSGQLDVVIELPFVPSFPMPGGRERLYMAESVALALEVKSNLSSQWDQVEDSCKQLRTVRRIHKKSTAITSQGIVFGSGGSSTIPYMAVGYTGYRSIDALQSRFESTPAESRPDAALVIDTGVLYSGDGARASGPWGLFALSALIFGRLNGLSVADIDFGDYAK